MEFIRYDGDLVKRHLGITPTGEKDRVDFGSKIDKNGALKIFVKEKKIPWYDYIQSHRDSCDISVILKRYAMGEFDLIKPVSDSQFFDACDCPETLIEAQNLINKAKETFNSLSVDDKNLFDNNFFVWLSKGGVKLVDTTKKDKEISDNLKDSINKAVDTMKGDK